MCNRLYIHIHMINTNIPQVRWFILSQTGIRNMSTNMGKTLNSSPKLIGSTSQVFSLFRATTRCCPQLCLLLYKPQQLVQDGGFHKWGIPKWLVYKGQSHLEMDDDWGYPHFRKPPYIYHNPNSELGVSWTFAKFFWENQTVYRFVRPPYEFLGEQIAIFLRSTDWFKGTS